MTDLAATLKERGSRHGDFAEHGNYSQAIKLVIHGSPNWTILTGYQKEALEMIAHKIARILSGDPDYADNWHDIAGYAKLVDDRLEAGTQR